MICHNSYKNKGLYKIIATFSHYQKVNFAFYCAKEVELFANDQRIIDCNNVLQRWLKGDKTVDLELAINDVWNTVNNTYYYVVNASYNAAYAAYDAVRPTYYANNAVYHAAHAKSYNLWLNNYDQRSVTYKQFYKEYKQIAQNWLSLWNIPNFPKESDFPIFDYLQDYNLISYLLLKKEDYYYLNLNGFDIKHVNEAELLKLIDTTHIKNIIRRIINNDSAQQL